MPRYYPVMLNITNKKCIIIGGGNVAYRKALSMLDYDAEITVISSNLCAELEKLKNQGNIKWISRNYELGDLNNAYLVFAATDNQEVNKQIFEESRKKNIPVNIVDTPKLCDFIVPSKIEQGDLTIAISTNGKSPALAKKIRIELEEKFGAHYAEFLDLLGNIRQQSIKEISDGEKREALYKELVYSDFLDRLREGGLRAEAEGAASPTRNAVNGEQPSSESEQVKKEAYSIFEKYKTEG